MIDTTSLAYHNIGHKAETGPKLRQGKVSNPPNFYLPCQILYTEPKLRKGEFEFTEENWVRNSERGWFLPCLESTLSEVLEGLLPTRTISPCRRCALPFMVQQGHTSTVCALRLDHKGKGEGLTHSYGEGLVQSSWVCSLEPSALNLETEAFSLEHRARSHKPDPSMSPAIARMKPNPGSRPSRSIPSIQASKSIQCPSLVRGRRRRALKQAFIRARSYSSLDVEWWKPQYAYSKLNHF